MKIELELVKRGGFPVGYDVMVEDVRWAFAAREHHGMHGTSYDIHQVSADGSTSALQIPFNPPSPRGNLHQARVRGATKSSRRDGDLRSTEQRIIDYAASLIEAGQLLDPVEVKRRAEAELDAYKVKIALADAERDKAFRNRALACLDFLPDLPDSEIGEDGRRQVAAIIEAMKWAQSQ
jgi:hypothetical protein